MTLLFNGIFRKKKDKTYCQNSWDNTEFNAGYRPHQKKEHRPRPSLCCTETGQRSSQGGRPPVSNLRKRLQHSHSWVKRTGVEFPMGGPLSDLPLGAHCWECVRQMSLKRHSGTSRCQDAPVPGTSSQDNFMLPRWGLWQKPLQCCKNSSYCPNWKYLKCLGFVCFRRCYGSGLCLWPRLTGGSYTKTLSV